MQQNIELHIDELFLHGFAPHQVAQIGDALQRELTRLLQEQGLPAGLSVDTDLGRLTAGTVTLQPDFPSNLIGHSLARSVYKGFQHENSSPPKKGK